MPDKSGTTSAVIVDRANEGSAVEKDNAEPPDERPSAVTVATSLSNGGA